MSHYYYSRDGQPIADKDDLTAAWTSTVRDLVKAERERDEALRLHVEDHARIDVLLDQRDEALAALARVRALADECDRRDEHPSPPWDVLAATLRAALEGP